MNDLSGMMAQQDQDPARALTPYEAEQAWKLQIRALSLDSAALAIEGMLPGELANTLEALEKLYQREVLREKTALHGIKILDWEYRDEVIKHADAHWSQLAYWRWPTLKAFDVCCRQVDEYAKLFEPPSLDEPDIQRPIGILREMVALLVREYQKKVNTGISSEIDAQNAVDRIRQKERHDDLSFFLRTTFPVEHAEAAERNMDTYSLAKSLLLQGLKVNLNLGPMQKHLPKIVGRKVKRSKK